MKKTKKPKILEQEINHYLPVKAISINECFQGRRFKTKKYDAFIQEMLYTMPKKKTITGLVRMEILLYLKSILRSDIDNFVKPILDCIVKKGWIVDDRYIQYLKVSKVKSKEEGVYIFIESLE